MSNLQELEMELRIAQKYNFEKREIENLQRLIELKKPKGKKKMKFTKILGWVVAIFFIAAYSFSAYPQEQTVIYELFIDFGNDAVFLHEVTTKKWYCEERVKFIYKSEHVKAYCVKRWR